MNKLSLIAFDLDGTVIDSVKRTISPRVQSALERAHELGAYTCVSTARPPEFLGEQLEAFSWIDFFSVSDGALVIDHASGEPVIVEPLGRERSLELIDSLADLDASWEVYATHSCHRDTRFAKMVSARDDRNFTWTPELVVEVLRGMDEVDDIRALVDSEEISVVKLDCLFETPEVSRIAEQRLATRNDIEFARMYDLADFEITARGVTKGTAIAKLIERYGLDPALAVAFGDSGNDLSMTGHAYRFIAMGNATPEIKAAADEICLSIDEDGVAVWLEEHLGLS